jgi:ATP-dependent DNA ligase
MARTTVARFIAPTECLPVTQLPDGSGWTWEIKLDGCRMEVVKSAGNVTFNRGAPEV